MIRSPFPGMDPYLEAHWGDVHSRLVIYGCDLLQDVLPEGLRARVEERVFLETPIGEGRSTYPDVRVVEDPRAKVASAPSPGGVVLAEPIIIRLPAEPITETFIQILDARRGGRVVTVIEFLSPSNKLPGAGQRLYQEQREELYLARTSLVEIDLLRKGQRIFTIPPTSVPPSHRTPYQVCVWRGWRPDRIEIYAAPLRERLPGIRIPLRESDTDVPFDLQAVVDLVYRIGRYDDMDYTVEPDPSLEPEDQEWADALLREKGLR